MFTGHGYNLGQWFAERGYIYIRADYMELYNHADK
jgi:hypothetical protein